MQHYLIIKFISVIFIARPATHTALRRRRRRRRRRGRISIMLIVRSIVRIARNIIIARIIISGATTLMPRFFPRDVNERAWISRIHVMPRAHDILYSPPRSDKFILLDLSPLSPFSTLALILLPQDSPFAPRRPLRERSDVKHL